MAEHELPCLIVTVLLLHAEGRETVPRADAPAEASAWLNVKKFPLGAHACAPGNVVVVVVVVVAAFAIFTVNVVLKPNTPAPFLAATLIEYCPLL